MGEGRDTEMGLIVSFPDQSESFVHGFEAGMLWLKMERGEEIDTGFPIHTANITVVERMAQAGGYCVTFEATDWPEWTSAVFERLAPQPARPRLRAIDGGLTRPTPSKDKTDG